MTVSVFSYLRVSGQGQVQGDGFPRQRKAVEDFASQSGFLVTEEFRDEGVSGTSELSDRPSLVDLLSQVETTEVRIVLVEKADRLARDLMVQEVILAEFRKQGVKVIECGAGTDLTIAGHENPTGKLIRQILGAIAEFDKNITVLKLRAARERKRRSGERCEGPQPFGSLPGEGAVLDRIRQLRRKPRTGNRLSFAAVARTLNEEGHQTRKGGPWHPETVRKILNRRS